MLRFVRLQKCAEVSKEWGKVKYGTRVNNSLGEKDQGEKTPMSNTIT